MHPMSSSRTVLQAKLSALTAATSAAVVFAVGIAVISVRAILDRAFQGSWRINWVLSVEVIGIISGAWFLVVFSSTFIQLRRRDRQELTRNPSFPATVFVMLLYSGGVLLSVTLYLG